MKSTNKQPSCTSASQWFLPSFSSLGLTIYPLMTIFRHGSFLRDPGIGWHLVAGRYMIENNVILTHDIFSFTKSGEYWLTYEWLFQYIFAGIEKLGGLPLITVIAALIYSAVPSVLLKQMIRQKSNIYIAIALFFVAAIGLIGHAHLRPHIFTYLFFTLLIDRVLMFDSGSISKNSLYLFVPIMILWANLHGGFAIGLVVCGLAFLTSLFRYIVLKDNLERKKAKIYFLFTCAMTAASLVNPFGAELHLSILKYLDSNIIHYWNEFGSPDFNKNSCFLIIFQILIFLLFIIHKKSKITPLEYVLILFFIYESLHAIRHIFLFLILFIPILARELTLKVKGVRILTSRSDRITAEQNSLKSDRFWFPAISLIFILLALLKPDLFKKDLYGPHLTESAGIFIEKNIELFDRPFNTMDTGGVLSYYFWPRIKVFCDDRLDFYGEKFFSDQYFRVYRIEEDWEKVLNGHNISSAILKDKRISTLLKASPNWVIVYEDDKNQIFVKKQKGDIKSDRAHE